MRLRSSALALVLATGCFPSAAFAMSAPSRPPATGGTVYYDRSIHAAYVADVDGPALHRVDLSSGEVETLALDCAPEQVLPIDSRRVAVSLKSCGKVAFINVENSGALVMEGTADVAPEPWGLATSTDGLVLVTSAWGHTLTALDPENLTARYTLNLPREPRGIVLSPDGSRAFITHVVGDAVSVVDLNPAGGAERPTVKSVRVLTGAHRNRSDAAAGAATAHPTASLAYTAVWNATGTRLFVPHLLVQNGQETSRIVAGGYGGVAVNEDSSVASVAVLVGATGEPLVGPTEGSKPHGSSPIHQDGFGTSSIAPSGSRTRQARGAAVLGDSLFVTSYGTGELVELDARSLDPAMSVKRRFAVGDGPGGVQVDESLSIAIVYAQLSNEVSVVNLGSGTVDRFPVGQSTLSEERALGRRLFHAENNHSLSRDGRSCAGCHPEGRSDGLVWRLGDGSRKTLFLAGRLNHGPYGWNGEHADLEGNIAETIFRLGGMGLSEKELSALALYVRDELKAPPQTPRQETREPLIARGKELFESDQVGCVWCHRLDTDGSDRTRHDVGSRAKGEEKTAFRTPPLRFVSGAGPYFHDGRYATLEALLEQNLDRMGNTSALSSEDRTALAAFLRSL